MIKKIFAFTIASLLTLSLYSQGNTGTVATNEKFKPTHELSVGALQLFSKQETVQYYYPFWNSYYIEPPFYSNYGPQLPKIGLSYKIHFKNWTLRLRDDFIGYTQKYWAGTTYQKLSGLENKVNVGFQKEKKFRRVAFFYGVDLFYEKEYSKSIYEYENSPTSINTSDKDAFGISPFIGAYYLLTPRLSLSFESNYDVQYFELDDIYTYDGTESSSKYNGILAQFGPLGMVSVNFHLGGK